jgi:trimethylamine:corrinoid methyltransferase-like protein
LIARVGPGGNFLAQRHTLQQMRQFPARKFRESSDAVDTDARERALTEARRLIESHQVPPLPTAVDATLERIVTEAASA